MNLQALREPFPAEDIEWRVGQAGEKNGRIWAMVLAYVTARAVQERLDDVCGPENWQNQFRYEEGGSVLCGLSIRCGDEWVTKWDGASNTEIDPVKGGLSGAEKRAAVQWGVGRYLYSLEEGWANVHEGGKMKGKTKENKWFKWDPPPLPSWALPSKDRGEPPKTQPEPAQAATDPHAERLAAVHAAALGKGIADDSLLTWCREKYQCREIKYLNVGQLREVWSAVTNDVVTKALNAAVPS